VFKDKSHDKINDDRASERKKRQVNKIHPYRCGFNTESLSPPLAHPEGTLLKPFSYLTDHNYKIKKIVQTCNNEARN
jgi:hypothetical protein